MIVIPACLGVLAVAAALLLFLTVLLPQSGSTWLSQHDVAETRSELVSLAEDWLSEADPAQQTALAARLEETAAAHQMVLVIRQDGGEAGRFGQGRPRTSPASPGPGGFGGQRHRLRRHHGPFSARCIPPGVTYQLEVYSQGVVTDLPHQTEHLAATLLAAAVVMVLAAVLVTNRFLTRFVFRHIQEPLETLAEGVHQIRDGNLTHRIAYDSRDEFQPVCEDFNDMAQRLRASVEQSQREEASRKELLASISHDIRSPPSPPSRPMWRACWTGVADTPEKQREYLTILQAKATEMDQLVRKIFRFSKMDLGEYPYSPEPLDPAQEVEAVVAASRGGLPASGPVHHRGTPAHRLPGAGRSHLLPQHPHQPAGQQRQV